MSGKKCLTYNSLKDRGVATATVQKLCFDIFDGKSTIKNLQRLCGCMSYVSIFIIPEYKLEDNNVYTFENICQYVPGLLKLPLHDMLDSLGNITLPNTEIIVELKKILHEALYAETVDLLHVRIKDTYCALAIMYFKLLEDEAHMQVILNMYLDMDANITQIWTYFEREVFNNGKCLY